MDKLKSTECVEGPRKTIEAVHTKLRKGTIKNAVDLLDCYYQVLKKTAMRLKTYKKTLFGTVHTRKKLITDVNCSRAELSYFSKTFI